jgi:hypothetical protein
MEAGNLQGVIVILIGGLIGGTANVLVSPDPIKRFKRRLTKNVVLGITAAVIAFGISGTATGSIWQQLSTCTVAGIGGGQIVRSYSKSKQLQTDETIIDEYEKATKESLTPGPQGISEETVKVDKDVV